MRVICRLGWPMEFDLRVRRADSGKRILRLCSWLRPTHAARNNWDCVAVVALSAPASAPFAADEDCFLGHCRARFIKCLEGRKIDSCRNRANLAVVARPFRSERNDSLDFDGKTPVQLQERSNTVAVRGVTHRIA